MIFVRKHKLRFYKQKGAYANLDNMSQNFQAGDFLVFQLEAGFAMLRLLAMDGGGSERVWHIAAYGDFFPDVESAEAITAYHDRLTVNNHHIALTTRAFESTQVARIANIQLTDKEMAALMEWRKDPERRIYDRSVRLMLGMR